MGIIDEYISVADGKSQAFWPVALLFLLFRIQLKAYYSLFMSFYQYQITFLA